MALLRGLDDDPCPLEPPRLDRPSLANVPEASASDVRPSSPTSERPFESLPRPGDALAPARLSPLSRPFGPRRLTAIPPEFCNAACARPARRSRAPEKSPGPRRP
ncbi:hypothetical protein KM043_012328 [Ampulex compressa]|nr:hypothetical protein KM043_012328 [Ampulex compressa]